MSRTTSPMIAAALALSIFVLAGGPLRPGGHLAAVASEAAHPVARLRARARAIHAESPLIDGHNDYPWAVRENAGRDLDKLDLRQPQPSIMTDIARLKAGGVGGQFWSVYVPVA